MPLLQQNLSTSIPAGPFMYSTDGITPNGAITATMLTVNLYKNGAVSTYVPTTDNWSTASPSSRGIYLWTLTTDAVDTIGNWTAHIHTTNSLPVREDYVVRSSNIDDFIHGTSAPGGALSISSGVWNYTSRDLSTYAGLSSAVWQETSRLLTSFNLSSNIWAYTSRDLSTYAGLSSAVWQETTRTLTTWNGLSTVATTFTLDEITSGVWEYAARLLTSGAVVADNVWDELRADHLTTLTFGDVTALTDMTSGVWAYADRTLTSWGGLSTVATTFTLDEITSGVWNYTSRDLSTYAGLSSAVWTDTTRTLTSYGGASTLSAADISTAVWAEAVRSLTSFGHSSAVWSYTSRDLSTYAGLSSAVWQETSRMLTSFNLSSNIWEYTSRDLSTYAGLSSAVWGETTRSLTTAAVITSDIMNRTYDGALTFVQGMRLMTGVLVDNSTGGGTTAVGFTNFSSTKVRITYTVTTAGNRAVSTYDLTS